MSDEETVDFQQPTTVIIKKRENGNALGIASFVFGVISIFVPAIVVVLIAVILGVIAVIKKQWTWGILGLVCAVIGFVFWLSLTLTPSLKLHP
jgi:hypothetical protein